MSSTNRYPGIDHRLVASVRHHARRAISKLPGMELEDVEQELILHAHRRLNAYDPDRSDLWTFADRILTNFVANLVRAANAPSRGNQVPLIPLDEMDVSQESDQATEMVGNRGGSELDWCRRIHLRHDLKRVQQTLPRHLRDCCQWLMKGSVTEAAKQSNLARGSIYCRMSTLRHTFRRAGLESYISPANPTLPPSAR